MRSRVSRQLADVVGRPREGATALFSERVGADAWPLRFEGFSPHDQAVWLLHVAAEIEHGLLIQYLFAAYCLGGPQVPAAHRADVRRWQTVLLGIAREEMGHFVTVQNLLKLIGGPLNLERSDFPWDQEFYPFPFALEPPSRKLLARYVCIESPEVWPEDWAHRKDEIEALAFGGAGGFKRVGVIYDQLKQLLADPTLIGDAWFNADTLGVQASFDEYGRGYAGGARGAVKAGDKTPDVLIGTAFSRQTALEALDAIAQQGEASDTASQPDEISHFERFMLLYEEYPDATAGWSPCRPVVANPRILGGEAAIPDTTYIDNDVSRRWAQLLNLRYRMLLTYLGHSFRIAGDAGPAHGQSRGAVLNRVFGEMYNLRALSGILVTLPAGAPEAAARAGPSFELPYTLNLPYRDSDAWRVHLDLIDGARDLIGKLQGSAGADADAYLASLAAMDAEARTMLETVTSLAPLTPSPEARAHEPA